MHTNVLWCGDLGDGRFQNPVLFADYSDPDVIRVGDTYYMTASSFNYVPGLPILTSPDLVNWTLQNYALPNIPEARYALPRHAQGVWAPAIRHHNGRFYIYYGMPDEGIFMVSTEDALGQWDAPVCVLPGKGLIDPCPFFAQDGSAYVVHGYAKSRIGFKSFLGLFPMSPDGTHAIGADHLLYDGRQTQPTIEGPKVYARDGYVYIFAPAGGVSTGWQTVLRARSIHGPFEERIVLRQGDTPINGPHQGALVDAPDGSLWFVHFQSRGCYGRVIHLQPVAWGADGWPVIGIPNTQGDPEWGQPTLLHAKPAVSAPCAPCSLQASDDFSGDTLALQWQFMGAWREDFYSLHKNRDHLRLYARMLPETADPVLWHCPQTLTQKFISPCFDARVTLVFDGLQSGDQAGLSVMGGQYAYAAVRSHGAGRVLLLVSSQGEGDTRSEQILFSQPLPDGLKELGLGVHVQPEGNGQGETNALATFSFGQPGKPFQPLGDPYRVGRHTWVGAKLGLFAMPLVRGCHQGYADFSAFTVEYAHA